MSVEHAIDLLFRSQDLFVSSLKEIIILDGLQFR